MGVAAALLTRVSLRVSYILGFLGSLDHWFKATIKIRCFYGPPFFIPFDYVLCHKAPGLKDKRTLTYSAVTTFITSEVIKHNLNNL